MIAVASSFSDRSAFKGIVSDSRIRVGFELECASIEDIRGFQRKLLNGGFGFIDWNTDPANGNLRAFEGYTHRYPELWNVESDSSVPVEGRYRNRIEFKSPPLPMHETLAWIDKLFPFISEFSVAAGKEAGFHTSYSIEGVNLKRRTNFVKLLMLLGETHMADSLNRGSNHYAQQLYDNVKANIQEKFASLATEQEKARFMRDMLDNRLSFTEFYPTLVKYLSINLTKLDAQNYVEFRLLGGVNYLKKPAEIKRMMARFGYALKVASDPRALREEYSATLYSILTEQDERHRTLSAGDLRWSIDTAGRKIVIAHRVSGDVLFTMLYHDNGGEKHIFDYAWVKELSAPDKEVVRRRIVLLLSKPALCAGIDIPLVYTTDLFGPLSYHNVSEMAALNPGTYEWALRAYNNMRVEPPTTVIADMLNSDNPKVIRELLRLILQFDSNTALLQAVKAKIFSDPQIYGVFVNTHGEIIDYDDYWVRTGATRLEAYQEFERELLDRFEHSDDLGLEDLGNTDVEDVHFEPTAAPPRRRRSRRSPEAGAEVLDERRSD